MSEMESSEVPFEGKRLFTVEIEQTVVVLASDACEAEEIAKEQAACGGDIDWNDSMYGAYEAGRSLPADWVKAIPFGMGTIRQQTCQQIRDAWDAYEVAKPPTTAELEALGQQRLI